MSAADVKAVCDVLLGTARLGIAQLRPVLVAAPQLLACSAEDMQKQVSIVANENGCGSHSDGDMLLVQALAIDALVRPMPRSCCSMQC